ncbi:DUF3093 domain-containing protein [Lysinibacter sp. HNR]|uniref:DUF3093 domain-containing protein n=1 Tax=Lysinibacter sp. HNR TaxID=3031408 RepID=UPI002436040C|nr:DUF3093 domain-containing protein [Lysinibacter sp. HNR]WGD36336.1 DUF3093 domain-containing protein [Lysinibacter sp. HNR]
MRFYSERLVPGVWTFVATFLIVPGTVLVIFPINQMVAVISAAVLYLLCVTLLIATSPVVRVEKGQLNAGRAKISVNHLGKIEHYDGDDATQQRGPLLDARAHLVIRGWVSAIVRIELNDPQDPTPYWIISTRHPQQLADAIRQAQEQS